MSGKDRTVTKVQNMGMEVEQDYSISLDPFKCYLISVKFQYWYLKGFNFKG